MTTRGFVTVATGSEHYYKIAANLLVSYRRFSANPLPFALICDTENEYSAQFDDLVLLDNPHCSYLDKLVLPRCAPYDETIFIDSDSLAYRDLNAYFDFFKGQADFTALGKTFPTDYPYAWFKIDEIGEYKSRVSFIPDFVGGVYFVRKSRELEAFAETVTDVWKNYYRYKFRQFAKPCDEPIFALSMAAHGFKPINSTNIPVCFFPQATKFFSNIETGTVAYANYYEPANVVHSWAYMVHWGNTNTHIPLYDEEVAKLKCSQGTRRLPSDSIAVARIVLPVRAREAVKSGLDKVHLLDLARKTRNLLRAKRRR